MRFYSFSLRKKRKYAAYLELCSMICLYILSFNFSSLNTENHVTLAITPVSIIATDSSFNYCLNHWTSWKKTVWTFITGVLFLVPIENSALTSGPNMDSFQIKCKINLLKIHTCITKWALRQTLILLPGRNPKKGQWV